MRCIATLATVRLGLLLKRSYLEVVARGLVQVAILLQLLVQGGIQIFNLGPIRHGHFVGHLLSRGKHLLLAAKSDHKSWPKQVTTT